jgi:hypothetical protein
LRISNAWKIRRAQRRALGFGNAAGGANAFTRAAVDAVFGFDHAFVAHF